MIRQMTEYCLSCRTASAPVQTRTTRIPSSRSTVPPSRGDSRSGEKMAWSETASQAVLAASTVYTGAFRDFLLFVAENKRSKDSYAHWLFHPLRL